MNKLSLRNLKKNLLPSFLILVFLVQPVFSLAANQPFVPPPDMPQNAGPTDYNLVGEYTPGPDDNINNTDTYGTDEDSGYLGENPFETNGEPDPFETPGEDDFTPGVPIDGTRGGGLFPLPEGAQFDENGVYIDGTGSPSQAATYSDGNILTDEVPSSDGGGGTSASLGSYTDRALSDTLRQVQKASISQSASSSNPETNVGPGSAAACVAGKLLSTILASTITTAINGIINTAETAIGTAIGLLSVPVADWNVKIDTLRTKEQLQFQNAARVGTSAGLPGSINALVNVGWDSVGYCIINSMIDYIARSTIAWAKSGFKGNPAFIENPGKFFKEIGDIEASSFLNTLAYGVLGQSICQPFRAQIVLTIARDYLNSSGSGYYGSAGYGGGGYGGIGNGRNYGGCTLDDAKNNLKGFLKGNFNQGGWGSWFQISQIDTNNPYSIYLNLSSQLGNKISQKKTIADKELTWNKGFLSFRKCENKNMKPEDCPIVTPGNLIEDQLSKTLNLSKERLVLAEKFDQVLDVVINQLINTALNKILN